MVIIYNSSLSSRVGGTCQHGGGGVGDGHAWRRRGYMRAIGGVIRKQVDWGSALTMGDNHSAGCAVFLLGVLMWVRARLQLWQYAVFRGGRRGRRSTRRQTQGFLRVKEEQGCNCK